MSTEPAPVKGGVNVPGGQPAPVQIPLPGGPSGRTVWPMKSFYTPHAVKFLDPSYHAGYPDRTGKPTQKSLVGYWHTGTDMNGPGGRNTDQGDPLVAIRDGVIEWTGVGSGTWGRLVVLRFQVEGKTYWARYGHIQQTGKTGAVVKPAIGQSMKSGETLAFVGRGNDPQMLAHLHFDIFHTKPPRWDWWPTRNGPTSEVTKYCTDPDAFLRRLGAVKA